jgi:glucose uptake protein GlcU
MAAIISQFLFIGLIFLAWYRHIISTDFSRAGQLKTIDGLLWAIAGLLFLFAGHLAQQATPNTP